MGGFTQQDVAYHSVAPRSGDTPVSQPGQTMTEHRLIKRLVLFAVAFAFWLLLVWPIAPSDGRVLWGDIAVGLIVAGLVAVVMREIVTDRFGRLLNPVRYFWAVVYLFVFAYYVIKSNLDVAYRVLHPAMPIRPGIVKTTTKLRSASARTLLANSITLTPGTLTIDTMENGAFYVHWINVSTAEEGEATARILGRFEWFISKILE
jgi:multicomponent Na+:H+ antiporter subunit E